MPDLLSCDVAIAGGGLAGGLIALALAERQPQCDVRIVEAAPKLGGNHIWSFFDSDIDPQHRWLVDPLISHRWPAYDVAFPAHRRRLSAGYDSINSSRFDEVVRARLKPGSIIAATAAQVDEPAILLDDGSRIAASLVIDARGAGDLDLLDLGWQKFLGQRLRIAGGHGLTRPIVMDATVPQFDGYRFVYCLPFDANTVFVEDTYYSDRPDLPAEALRKRIEDYAGNRGWRIDGIDGEETGVLPVALGGDFEAYWASGGSAAKAGLRAALFHPTTGYTLPDAVRLAAYIGSNPRLGPAAIKAYAATLWNKRGFYRMLDTMLFRATEPDQRYRILERFYRLSPGLIGRFYAGQSTLADKVRILSGKPPVPIGRAVRALLEKRA